MSLFSDFSPPCNARQESTFTGNDHFLAYLPSWWYFWASMLTVVCLTTPLSYLCTASTRVTLPLPPPSPQQDKREIATCTLPYRPSPLLCGRIKAAPCCAEQLACDREELTSLEYDGPCIDETYRKQSHHNQGWRLGWSRKWFFLLTRNS